jgi:hypothetical protein
MRTLREVSIELYELLTEGIDDPLNWESYEDPKMGPLLQELRANLSTASTNTLAIEDVEALQEQRCRINALPLESITWTEKGCIIPVTQQQIEDFKFTGLSNLDFVKLRWWTVTL